MTRLVADIGGTNTRLALAEGGTVIAETQRRFANDDFPEFAAVVAAYVLDTAPGPLAEIVAALAGPTTPRAGRLTNRDWVLDADALAARFGAGRALLFNDLTALGQAVPTLAAEGVLTVHDGPVPAGADQALVAGIGTGFNVCHVLLRPSGTHCTRAEFGHVTLPSSVADLLRARFGDTAGFTTVEDCFSGRGHAELAERGTDGVLFAGLVGAVARDLRMAFVPDAGLYLAGSVARAVLEGDGIAAFRAEYTAATQVDLPPPPVRIIRDDMAALRGCARVVLG